MEYETFIFPVDKIQGCYWIKGEEDAPSSTVVHLENWVCPIGRPDPDKKFYYFLRKILKPKKVDA